MTRILSFLATFSTTESHHSASQTIPCAVLDRLGGVSALFRKHSIPVSGVILAPFPGNHKSRGWMLTN